MREIRYFVPSEHHLYQGALSERSGVRISDEDAVLPALLDSAEQWRSGRDVRGLRRTLLLLVARLDEP